MKTLRKLMDNWVFNGLFAIVMAYSAIRDYIGGEVGFALFETYFSITFGYTAVANFRGYNVVTFCLPKDAIGIRYNYKESTSK